MALLGDLKTLAVLVRRPGTLLRRRSYVLILSHMRSYSSVLAHVLGSHEEIAGYAEMHQAYEHPTDLLRLRARLAWVLEGRLEGRFLLDKVLHNRSSVAPAILDRDDVRTLFLVREPPAALASILAMNTKFGSTDWRWDVEEAAEYYVTRLRALAALAGSMRSEALFVPSEAVVGDTEAVLRAITGYLGLGSPLTPSYQTFKHTGAAGWGDFSHRIRSGRIEPGPIRETHAEYPDAVLGSVWAAYDSWRASANGHRMASPAPTRS